MLLRPKKCYIFKNIYLFRCLKVISDTLGSFWLKNSSDFGKVQCCPELSNFSWFFPVLATGEDISTIVRLLYKPWKIYYSATIIVTHNEPQWFLETTEMLQLHKLYWIRLYHQLDRGELCPKLCQRNPKHFFVGDQCCGSSWSGHQCFGSVCSSVCDDVQEQNH